MGYRVAGFTLVELMVVIAIVMVLAAIAIPGVHTMQLKAKVAELEPNVDGIQKAAVAYLAAYDGLAYTPSDVPVSHPGKSAVDWPSGSAFDTIGWAPDGRVRGRYGLSPPGGLGWTYRAGGSYQAGFCPMVSQAFCAFGDTDVDGDQQGRGHFVWVVNDVATSGYQPVVWAQRY